MSRRRKSNLPTVLAGLLTAAVLAFFWYQNRPSKPAAVPARKPAAQSKPAPAAPPVEKPPEKPARPAASAPAPVKPVVRREPATPLASPPEIVRGVYLTSWSAGIRKRVDYVIGLRAIGINAVVIDIKDYSGYIAYRTGVAEATRYGAVRPTVRDIDAMLDRFHEAGIYVIARITVFQDPILAAARPELAVHSRAKLGVKGKATSASTVWRDRKDLAWLDPSSREVWDYIVDISNDAASHGFDELNFDYVRFPSDGDLKDMVFPAWDGKTAKNKVIRSFFADLRKRLPGVKISADLFGLATVNNDDLGIGQVIEDGYLGFDFVCPMVYPSHYARGFLGHKNPAEHPYQVVNYSMQRAFERLESLSKEPPAAAAEKPQLAKLRPWLQDFHLGAKYDAAKVKSQIKAVEDALGERYAGYLLWSPSNVYTRAALE